MRSRYYIVAGHAFSISMFASEDSFALPSYEPFAVDALPEGTSPLFTLVIDDSFYPTEKGDSIGDFECGAADFGVYRLADGTYQMLISPPKGKYCGLLQANSDFSQGTIATRGQDSLRVFAVNNALMLMYAFASATKGTLLVHASVIKNEGMGYLFLGHSGTGKSTHSSLWLKYIEDSELLNDDNPVIRVDEKKIMVYGSPWSGKTPCYKNDAACVGAFVRIRQCSENHIVREQPLKAFATLLPSMSTMKWDKRVYDGVCDSVGKLVAMTPLYTLDCRPDKEAAELCSKEVKTR